MPKGVEAGSEVGTLFFEDGETLAIALGVACGRCFGVGAAVKLFAGVKNLERENGEAIDHQSRRFGV